MAATHASKVYEPTPAEIAAGTAKIRSEWTLVEEANRRGNRYRSDGRFMESLTPQGRYRITGIEV